MASYLRIWWYNSNTTLHIIPVSEQKTSEQKNRKSWILIKYQQHSDWIRMTDWTKEKNRKNYKTDWTKEKSRNAGIYTYDLPCWRTTRTKSKEWLACLLREIRSRMENGSNITIAKATKNDIHTREPKGKRKLQGSTSIIPCCPSRS